MERGSQIDEHRERIVREILACKGNLRRVHEELVKDGIELSYPNLTRYIRQNNLTGKKEKMPAGRYEFSAGDEMQFDTSPHKVTFSDGTRLCQCASLILGYSRMLCFQYYPRFSRLECKIFLTKALQVLGGACKRCIVDNTNLVVLHGTGDDAVMAPEMEGFAGRFGFYFKAYRLGDKNRNAKDERAFHYIENNFLVKRVFADFEDLNRRALVFCEKNNNSVKRRLKARPVDLYQTERLQLQKLPSFIPEPYRVFQRRVDVEGYIHLHTNRYSVPYQLIGADLEVREYELHVKVYKGPRELAVHHKLPYKGEKSSTQKQHRPERGKRKQNMSEPLPEERKMIQASPLFTEYLKLLRKRSPGRAIRAIKRLHRLFTEYPAEALEKAMAEALRYGMTDLNRLESMVLRCIAGDFFRLPFEDHHD